MPLVYSALSLLVQQPISNTRSHKHTWGADEMRVKTVSFFLVHLAMLAWTVLSTISCTPEGQVVCRFISVSTPEPTLPPPYPEALSRRKYCFYLPTSLESGKAGKAPVVIFFHGTNYSASSSLESLAPLAEEYRFIAAAPDGKIYSQETGAELPWPEQLYYSIYLPVVSAFDLRPDTEGVTVNFDIPFVGKILGTLEADPLVDTEHIYLMGSSIGAFATYLMAETFSSEIKGIAPISGGIYWACKTPEQTECNVNAGYYYPGEPVGAFNYCSVQSCPIQGTGFHSAATFGAFIVHGSQDYTVPLFNAVLAFQQLYSEGHSVGYLFLDGVGHEVPIAEVFPAVWTFWNSLP
jgi:predicted peptidase